MKPTANESITFNFGPFDTEEDAALAHDWAARILNGPDAEVNFHDVIVQPLAAFLIRHSQGRTFRVGYYKKPGEIFRWLECRLADPQHPFLLAEKNLIAVKTGWLFGRRLIPVEGIRTLDIDGQSFKVVQKGDEIYPFDDTCLDDEICSDDDLQFE